MALGSGSLCGSLPGKPGPLDPASRAEGKVTIPVGHCTPIRLLAGVIKGTGLSAVEETERHTYR